QQHLRQQPTMFIRPMPGVISITEERGDAGKGEGESYQVVQLFIGRGSGSTDRNTFNLGWLGGQRGLGRRVLGRMSWRVRSSCARQMREEERATVNEELS